VDPVIPRQPSERHDWEIVTELALRTLLPDVLHPIARAVGSALRPERLVDVLLRLGPHRLSVAKLRGTPHGMDLGPLEAGRFVARLATADGHADVAPDDFVREARASLLTGATRRRRDELLLIGRRQLRDNNSWMHNAPRLVTGPARCTLLVHPDDAAACAVRNGDLARLTSCTGSVVVPVEISETMRRGVVSLPHGWGHDREGTRLGVAREHAGGSVNDVTSERHVDTLSGNAAFNGLPVTLTRVD
jgi:anaerobic selenocysteine-containing dehydrogenase